MNFFEKILVAFQTEMQEPVAFGWYHWLWIGLTVFTIAFLWLLRKYGGEKQLKWVLGIYGVVAAFTELSKQLAWSFQWDAAAQVASWDYQWYSAPFQLCSTPIYLALLCLLLKKGKLRESMLSYLALITVIGGLMTILMPDSCFCGDVLVNIHTMWLHCGSFVLAVYLIMSGNVRLNRQNWMRAGVIFLIMAGIAFIMNIGVYHSGLLGDETFNMFYISPYFLSELPVFVDIQQAVPYPVFLALYLVAVLLGSGVVFWVARGIQAGIKLCKQRVALHTR